MTSRNGSAAGRLPRGPARASPTFLSCVFLLTRDTRREYQGPGMQPGKSNVGFAQSKKEVADRLEEIRLAASEGHEIASHGCGHFDGGKWTRDDWLEEFASFRHILRDAYAINEHRKRAVGLAELCRDLSVGLSCALPVDRQGAL